MEKSIFYSMLTISLFYILISNISCDTTAMSSPTMNATQINMNSTTQMPTMTTSTTTMQPATTVNTVPETTLDPKIDCSNRSMEQIDRLQLGGCPVVLDIPMFLMDTGHASANTSVKNYLLIINILLVFGFNYDIN